LILRWGFADEAERTSPCRNESVDWIVEFSDRDGRSSSALAADETAPDAPAEAR
jgi:hypothetical protein